MAALDLYYFEPNILQTPKMIATEIVKLQVFLLPANFKLEGMTSHKQGLATRKYSFKMVASKVKFWTSFETTSFRIAGSLGG